MNPTFPICDLDNVGRSWAIGSGAKGLPHVCPRSGAVYADNGYCTKHVAQEVAKRGCHDGAIRKINMKDTNRDKGR